MSRTAASVISLVLGFPILAMVAVATVGGYNPKLLTTFLVGGVVMAFVVGAIFEIKRLLDWEDHAGSATTGSHAKPLEITVSDAPVDAPVAQEPVAPPAPERESRVETASSVPADAAIAPEPIVEPLPAAEPTPIKAKP